MERLFKDLPPTRKLYYTNSYLREMDSEVLEIVKDRGRRGYVVLDRTLFHPLEGGQPSDQGSIESPTGTLSFTVKKALKFNNVIVHYGVFNEKKEAFSEGNRVICRLDWERRYLIMRLHTAGHILDYAMTMAYGRTVEALDAFHGPPKAYLDYKVEERPMEKVLERYLDEIIKRGLEVRAIFVTREELSKRVYNAPNIGRIPAAERYRLVSIPGVNTMPCTGTHVKNTREVKRLIIRRIKRVEKGWRISYWVE